MVKKISFLILINTVYLVLGTCVCYPAEGSFSPAAAIKNYYIDPYTGSGNFTVPISLPPARKSLPNKLNLVYSSRAGTAGLGVGWKLDLAVIERSTKDGYPSYTSSDKFIFSLGGQQNELVYVSGQEYRAKTADIAWKFVFDGSRWTVKDNLGNTYYFGLDNYLGDYSRTKDPNNASRIFRWRISKITDPSGNSIIYKYLNDKVEIYYTEKTEAAKGSFLKDGYNYLIQIELVNSNPPKVYNCRPGFVESYPLECAGSVKSISVFYQSSLAKKYALNYTQSQITQKPLLSSITEYGSDGTSKNPPVVFHYSEQEPAYNTVIKSSPTPDNGWSVRYASGLTQKSGYDVDSLRAEGFTYSKGLEPAIKEPVKWSQETAEKNGNIEGFSWVVESNGNIKINGKKNQAFCITTYLTPKTTTGFPELILTFNENCHANVYYIDANGEETSVPKYNGSFYVDLYQASQNRITITGYNFDSDFSFDLNYDIVGKVSTMRSFEPFNPQLSGDFNGDGLTDLGVYNNDTDICEIALCDRTGFLQRKTWITGFAKDKELRLGDFNGDGKTDIAAFNTIDGTWRVAVSDGTQFIDKGIWISGFGTNLKKFSTGDFNGDGKTDIGGVDNNDVFWVGISDGLKFNKKTFSGLFPDSDSRIIADLNGDGISEFVFLNNQATPFLGHVIGYNNTWEEFFQTETVSPVSFYQFAAVDADSDNRMEVCVYDGKRIWLHSKWQYSPASGTRKLLYYFEDGSSTNPGFMQFGDFNGDGLMDFVVYTPSGDMKMILADHNPPVDLLIGVENGWGGGVNFEYTSSSLYDNKDDTGQNRLPFSVPVVSAIKVSDGRDNSYTTSYIYSKGYYDPVSKEFRGFGKVVAVDSEGNITETEFLQSEIFKGKIASQKVKNKDGVLFAQTCNTWSSAAPYAGTAIVSLKETIQSVYDDAAQAKTKKTTYEYDAYGNPIKIKEWGDVDLGGDERETISEYTYDTTNWQISYPSHIYIRNASGNNIREKWLYYTNGLLTKEAMWGYNPITLQRADTVTLYNYDAFGNPIKVTDALNRITLTEYDASLHTYPVKITNALGQITQYTYDPKTGLRLSEQDRNNQITRNVYDSLGRLSKVIGPYDTDADPRISYRYYYPVKNELLKNMSFEIYSKYLTGTNYTQMKDFPLDWLRYSTPTALYPTIDRTEAKTGKSSVKLFIDNYLSGSATNTIYYTTTTEGLRDQRVKFSCWVKTTNADFARIYIDDGYAKTYSQYCPATGTWQLLEVERNISYLSQSVSFYLTVTGTYGKKAYFDDASAIVISEAVYKQPLAVEKTTKTSYGTNPKYYTTYSFYDGLGRLIQEVSPAENTPGDYYAPRQVVSESVRYNSKGQVIEKTLPYFRDNSDLFDFNFVNNPKFVYSYDCFGRQTEINNPDGTSRKNIYSPRTASIIDENGHKTTNTYDAFGNIAKVEELNGTQLFTTNYAYDAAGQLTGITDARGNRTYFTYDTLGRKIRTNDPDMGILNYYYDAVGNLIKQVDARAQIIDFEYDNLDRLTKKKSGGNILASYTYDGPVTEFKVGRLVKAEDPSGSEVFSYDKLGRTIKNIKTVGATAFTVERTFDVMDRVVSLKYPDGDILNYTYNDAGQIERIASASGPVYLTNADYSPNHQITRLELSNGDITDYTYDPYTLRLSQIKSTGNSGNIQDLNYTFDSVGNIRNITDYANNTTQSFIYDDLNRLIQAQGSYGTLTYSYDSIGNLITKEGTTFTYGTPRPHAPKTSSDGYTYEYDSSGNLTKRTKGSNIQNFTYNSQSRLVRSEEFVPPVSQTVSIYLKPGINYFSLPFGPSMKISDLFAQIQDCRQEIAYWDPLQHKYIYNVNDPDFDQFDTIEYGKGYWIYITNPNGVNLTLTGNPPLSQTVSLTRGWNSIGCPAAAVINIPMALSPLVMGTDYLGVWRFYSETAPYYQQYSASKQEFTTLAPGEGYWLYAPADKAWQIQNTIPSSNITQFVYDYNSSRVKKVSSSGTTVYIGSIFESDSSGSTRKHIYLGANKICTIVKSGGTNKYMVYHSDHLGSSNVITNEVGARVALIEYKPFGNASPALPAQGIVPDYYFTGKEFDRSTGLYYYGARYYSPDLGKFTQPDSLIQDVYDPQSLNHYAYCRNNPLILTDPSGNTWESTWDSYSWGSFSDISQPFDSWSSYNYYNNYDSWQSYYQPLSFSNYSSINLSTTYSLQSYSSFGQGVYNFGYNYWQSEKQFLRSEFSPIYNAIAKGEWQPLWQDLKQRLSQPFDHEQALTMVMMASTGTKFVEKNGGLIIYRRGTFQGGSDIKGHNWAPENPATAVDYVKRYGLPAENSGKPDWIIKGRIQDNYTYSLAPRGHNAPSNIGGAIEIIPENPNDVLLDWFYMPD